MVLFMVFHRETSILLHFGPFCFDFLRPFLAWLLVPNGQRKCGVSHVVLHPKYLNPWEEPLRKRSAVLGFFV